MTCKRASICLSARTSYDQFVWTTFPFTQSSLCKVHANPVLVVDLEFEELRSCVKIATCSKETSPGIELGSLASQADALPIVLASPG